MFDNIFAWGIIQQGVKKDLIRIKIHDLRRWAKDRHKQVDDRPFGGGPGMILKPEPLFDAITDLKTQVPSPLVIFLTPQGKTLNQKLAETLTIKDHLILICGRYEGIDQRVRDKLVDWEISIGNYVLSGGEIPAMVLVDTISRLVPGVIGNEEFNKQESFSDPLDRSKLDHPQYTRPADYKGIKVPNVLLSGDHKEIDKWRDKSHVQ